MANVPRDLKYTREHEWAKQEGDRVRVGITAYAQEQLGDVVFVELPKVGAKVTAHQAFGVVESVKAVSDLFAPISGEVVETNSELPQKPETVRFLEQARREGFIDRIIAALKRAQDSGVRVTQDLYPYSAATGSMTRLLPR